MNNTVNPEMVLLAREAKGLSQAQLAKKLKVSQAAVSKAEKIPGKVSAEMLDSLATSLGFSRDFFLQVEHVFPASDPYHRKRKTLGKKLLSRNEAEANLRRIHIKHLLDSIEIPGRSVPCLSTEDDTTESIATKVRYYLQLPKGPIANLVSAMESMGIIIILCEFNSNKLDGFALRGGSAHPIVFINKDMPWCKARYTLARELGHLVMHDIPSQNMENEANEFASSLLMPADDILPYLYGEKLTLRKLATMKPIWKASMQAILYRAKQLGAVSPNQSRYLWSQMAKNGYRKAEPKRLDIQPNYPTLFKQLVDAHLNDLEYTIGELLEVLCVSHDYFEQLYPQLRGEKKKAKLRLI